MKKIVCFCSVVLAAAAALVIDSRCHLQLSLYELSFPELPEDFDGFRIVLLSDLHGRSFGKDNARLVQKVRELKPDLVALTGDFADRERELPTAEALLAGLEGTAALYWVNGNHEWYHAATAPDMEKLIAAHGGTALSNAFEPFYRENSRIVIAGAEDPNAWRDGLAPQELAEKLRALYPNDFVLWLGHRNFWVEKYPELPVDLVLSGHAHGGIVRLPFVGGLLNTNRSFGATFESGVYRSERFTMVVSRGLGNSIPVPRFLNRPDIVSITLRKE